MYSWAMSDSKDSVEHPTVVVVGARGFLGRGLVPALEREGPGVVALGREDAIVDARGKLTPAIARARAVYYLASTTNPKIANDHPDRVERDMKTFSLFLRAAAREDSPPVVVFPSSGGTVYDVSHPPPYDETSSVRASSVYGRAKLTMERALIEHLGERGRILRISNAYGPGQPVGTGQGVIAHWLHSALHGQEIQIFGDENVTRDFVFVDDVTAAFVRVAGSEHHLRVINIGSGLPTSLGELIDVMLDVVGRKTQRVARFPARGFDAPHSFLDTTRARAELAWKPEVSLHEGVERTWRSLLAGTG
jgi:UDP-glucose 4-epimerase